MKSVSSHLALAFALPFVLGSFAQASEDCSGENGACNVTAHDAAYVALAEALDVPLLTGDSRLASASGSRCAIHVVTAT